MKSTAARSYSAPQRFQQQGNPVCTPFCSCIASGGQDKSLHQSWLQLQDNLIEKDHSLSLLSDKVKQLSVHEKESKRKDDVISSLRVEVAQLQRELHERSARVATLDYAYSTNERTLLQKEGRILQLSDSVDNAKEKLSLAQKTNSGLQSQLSQKTSELAAKCEELDNLKKSKRFAEDGLNSTQSQMKEKQATVTSLNERIKRLKGLNEDLKIKFEVKQTECSRLVEVEMSLNQEVTRLKQKSISVTEQLSNTRKHLTETSKTNDELAVKVGMLQELLDSMCQQLKCLVGLHTSTSPSSKHDVQNIISSVSSLVTEQLKVKQQMSQCDNETRKVSEMYSEIENDMENLKNGLETLKLPFPSSVSREAMLSGAHSVLKKLKMHTECGTIMRGNLLSLMAQLSDMHSTLYSVSTCVKQHAEHGEGKDSKEGVMESVVRMSEEFQKCKLHCSQLEERLSITSDQHGSVMEQALSTLRVDYDRKMAEAVEKMRCKERENYGLLISEERARLENEKDKLIEECDAKVEGTNRNSELVQKQLKEKETELSALCIEIDNLKEATEKLIGEQEMWEKEIKEQKLSHEEKLLLLQTEWKMKEQALNQSILEYKVQSQEHARTIVVLETKLLSSIQNCSVLTVSNKELQTRVQTLESDLEKCQLELKNISGKTGGIIETLRRQLLLANEQTGKQRIEVYEMEETIKETKELYMKKIEELRRQHVAELDDLKGTLSRNETTIADLNCQLSEVKGHLEGKNEQVKQISEEKASLLNRVSTQANSTENGVGISEDASAPPLSSVGKVCLGEQHSKVISSQQRAIIELRKKVNDLMANKSPVPSHQAALKELVKLRQETAQLRADEIIRQETAKQQAQCKDKETALRERTNGLVSIHKLKDVEEALSQSEEAYNLLLSSVCSKLHCPIPNSVVTSQPFHTANKVARQHIVQDRLEFVKGPLTKAIIGLRRGKPYQEDVGLQVAESVMGSPPETRPATPDLTEFGVYASREVEELDKQKRLYQAISKRQEFKQTQQERIDRKALHSCLVTPEEAKHMVESMEKTYTDKLQKKDFEIAKLKKSLQKSQQHNNYST